MNSRANVLVATLAMAMTLSCSRTEETALPSSRNTQGASQDTAPVAQEETRARTLSIGSLAITVPTNWIALTGPAERQMKSEVQQGIDQMIERYRDSTGMAHREYGIRDFRALRLPSDAGWCILHYVTIPAQSDYYTQMESDTKQKLDWGISQGIFVKALENGRVAIGSNMVLRTILLTRDGGRMITVAHWSPKRPTDVTQLMVAESRHESSTAKQVDGMLAALTVTSAE
jgi:hypothetical protein